MQKEEITFERMPQAINLLLERIDTLERKIDALTPQKEPQTTIDINAASKIISKAIPTIYRLVRIGQLPAYKRGKKLYFIEEELREWILNAPISKNRSHADTAREYVERVAKTRKRRCVEI